MFVSVKSLTLLIDDNISYILDAKNHHDCTEEEYENYLDMMYLKLDKQLSALKSISCNHSLISRYERKINKVKEG